MAGSGLLLAAFWTASCLGVLWVLRRRQRAWGNAQSLTIIAVLFGMACASLQLEGIGRYVGVCKQLFANPLATIRADAPSDPILAMIVIALLICGLAVVYRIVRGALKSRDVMEEQIKNFLDTEHRRQ